MTAIKTQNISYSANGNYILKDISFEVFAGEFFGIAGPNGAGKSTLLKILSFLIKPCCGKVFVFDRQIQNYRRKDIAKVMAVMPAEVYIPYDFTVKDIVLMGRYSHSKWWGDYSKEDELEAEKILVELKLDSFKLRTFNSLSSGEKQKVLIAQSLCQKPKILLLDEPTSHLDIKHQIEIFSILAKLCKNKKLTIVTVSHDINLLSRYVDRIAMLKDGKLKAIGAPDKIITKENILKVYGANSSIAKVTPFARPHVYITNIKHLS